MKKWKQFNYWAARYNRIESAVYYKSQGAVIYAVDFDNSPAQLSATNGAEFIVNELIAKGIINPGKTHIIELDSVGDYAKMEFAWKDNRATDPKWHYISPANVEKLLGKPIPKLHN